MKSHYRLGQALHDYRHLDLNSRVHGATSYKQFVSLASQRDNRSLQHDPRVGIYKGLCKKSGRYDRDERKPAILWAYRTMAKKLTRHTPFSLVYGREAMILSKFIVPSLFMAQATQMSEESIQSRLMELMGLEEDRFKAQHH